MTEFGESGGDESKECSELLLGIFANGAGGERARFDSHHEKPFFFERKTGESGELEDGEDGDSGDISPADFGRASPSMSTLRPWLLSNTAPEVFGRSLKP